MVMGSLFDTPTDEEDQNPPQPQQPPPQDPLAQQPAPSYADMAQGASNIANTFAPPQPPTTGQDFIDAPTGSPRAQLEQERQGQSQYSSAGQALATALPMVAFGAPAAAAGLGIQAATQAAGLPQPVQDAASLLPFTEGGLVQRGLQAGLGGLGAYGGQQADQALNLPQIPGLGGPLALAGGIGGMGAAGLFDRGPRPETPIAQPEPAQAPNTTMAPVLTSTTSSYREPAETPAFYHETSPENARSILTEGRVSNDLSGRGVYVSDSPDLALGQSGKGAMVVLDPAKTEVQAVRPLGQSPEMAQQLGTNYITNRTTSGAVREVRFSADAIQSDPTVRGMVAYAQRGQVTPLTRGFDFQMNPDGSASWTRMGETTTTAPTSTTTTSGGMSPEEEKAYRAGYDLASVPGSNYGRPQYGWPNVGNGAEDNPLSNAHWAGVAQAQAEKMAAANGGPQVGPAGEPAQASPAQRLNDLIAQKTAESKSFDQSDLRTIDNLHNSRIRSQGWETARPGEARAWFGNLQRLTEKYAPEMSADIDLAREAFEKGNYAEIPYHTEGPLSAVHYELANRSGQAYELGGKLSQNAAPPPEAPAAPPESNLPAVRPPEQGLIAEGTDGTIHNITGFLGARGDGEQFFQTEDGVVPLSQLTNLSAADRAELGQMRTAAGGMPPNTPNAAPPSGPNAPGAAAFQQSPAGQQFAGQGAAGMNVTQPGVSSSNAAPSTTYGGGAGGITGQAPPAGRPPSGGGRGGRRSGPPPTLAGKIDWDPFHNLMSAIGAPTQPLLTGLHLARFAPQEALRPSVLGNGLRAMGEAALKGNADAVSAHINNDFGPNVPTNFRPEAMKAQSGNPPTSPTAVQKMINSVPVVGPILNRFREVNSALLGNLRDAHYLTTADRLARTDPNASPEMYNDLWREANNATGHSTIPGLSGNSVIGNMGLGPSAMAARVQELGNTVIGSGAPVPFAAAGSRAEAFKTLMGVAGTMAGTTALASALGANVNTTNPFTAFGVDSTFLKPVTTNGVFKTAYGTGGAGYDTVIKAAANIGNDLFNGDEKAALNHALAFSRGEFGVVPSGVIDAILGTTWDGKPYSWNDFLNEAKTGFMADQNGNLGQGRSVPIPAQDMGEAFRAYGPEGLLRAAPSLLASSVQTSPINTTSQAFKYATTPETLTRAFQGEDKPLATILQGKDWNDLMSTEKSALTKTLDPQVLQQIHDESYQRNPETTKHSDTVQYIAEKKLATENATLDRYNRKEITADQAASQMKAAQKEYFAVKNQLDSMPDYLAEQKKFDKSNESGAQIALDGFYQIPDKAGRAAYVAAIMQHDPELGARLLLATQPRNQSKLEELYYSGQLK